MSNQKQNFLKMVKKHFFLENKKFALTPAGFAFLVIIIFILVRSLIARNSYEILISIGALLFLFILDLIGFRAAKKFIHFDPGWKLPYPMTADSNCECIISNPDTPIPLFFRIHFIVRGEFFSSGYGFSNHEESCLVITETSIPRTLNSSRIKRKGAAKNTEFAQTKDSVSFQLDFPISGIFQGSGSCRLRDIFGLFSFPLGVKLYRTVKIRPCPIYEKKMYINAQTGAEDKRVKTSTDDERYYMREYAPGDRFRDINWKSSDKIDTLITRISPDTQEKISRIEIYFRNFGPCNKAPLESLWMLDRCKSLLSKFLKTLMDQNTRWIFNIHTAKDVYLVENEEGLDDFLENLAGISFSPPQNEINDAAIKTEIFVFSTACDTGLPGFIMMSQPNPVSLFFVQPADYKIETIKNCEIFHKRNFLLKENFPLLRFLINKKIKRLNINTGNTHIIYAGTKI